MNDISRIAALIPLTLAVSMGVMLVDLIRTRPPGAFYVALCMAAASFFTWVVGLLVYVGFTIAKLGLIEAWKAL